MDIIVLLIFAGTVYFAVRAHKFIMESWDHATQVGYDLAADREREQQRSDAAAVLDAQQMYFVYEDI